MKRILDGEPPRFSAIAVLICVWVMFCCPSWAAAFEVPPGASAADVIHAGEPRVEARLLVHPDDDPASGVVRVGVLLDIAPQWHVYWRNPGESGLPTRVRFDVSHGGAGPLEWPTPEVFVEADGLFTTFGYSERVLLVSRVEVDATGRVPESAGPRIAAEIDLLACRYECVPGSFALERGLSGGLSRSDGENAAAVRALFDQAAERLPVAPESLGARLEVRYDRDSMRPADEFRVLLTLRSCEGVLANGRPCPSLASGPVSWPFIPADEIYGLSPVSGTGDEPQPGVTSAELIGVAPEVEGPSEPHLRGVMMVRDVAGSDHSIAVDLPLPRTSASAGPPQVGDGWRAQGPHAVMGASAPTSGAVSTLWRALLLGFLGGLVLNLMPCVLPVLAIKVCSIAEIARHDRAEVVAHGAAYATGVLLSMWALAGTVIALRGAGSAVGWGFQFQEPLFVLAVCVVVVVFALNLFGVFEIGGPGGRVNDLGAQAVGWRRSFFEGLLAVVLATPCTAPFLGTAVGFAFASPGYVIMAIFTAVGAGLAAPFVLVSLIPGWGRFVPRPGHWMLALRSGLGFALLGSAVWLLWIAGRSLGADGIARMLAFLVAIAFGVWALGQLQRVQRTGWARGLAVSLLVFVVAGPLLVRLEPVEPPVTGAGPEAVLRYSPEALDRELAAGRPVFVVFTADWCITCKVNERGVIADEEIQSALRRWDVAVLRADWTRRDDGIRAELARFGRAGVPLYLIYAPGRKMEPVIMPELLSVDGLRTALGEAAAMASRTAGT